MDYDEKFMLMALRLARRGLGNVYPNPAVGCVIVNSNVVVGRGWTQEGGRPHAETIAINHAGSLSKGATAYVTLEPCCHYGNTGPCTLKLVNAGISRVVIASKDLDKRVSGNGIRVLKEAGLEVLHGVMCEQADKLNIGFIYSKIKNRPFITVKIATTLDGKIALPNQSVWITNQLTRNWVHRQRSMYDAIMVGSNTVVLDNPMLDCRLPGLEKYSPIRVIIDRFAKLNDNYNIIKTANMIPTYILTDRDVGIRLKHVRYLLIQSDNFFIDAMKKLVEIGITRLFVEGGGTLITELFKEKLVDKLLWCRANKLFGNEGISSINNLDIVSLQHCYELKKINTLTFGEDTVDVLDVVESNI
ncbi:bifunctional diaminohydroxyphosphoribosylaminopyrimidine deaminase/5-amino-6-(5-phosphoribosylamino)uracil reductase RibD [Neoehrlichia mikurensis]|uniref:Riboflavin biosynthesis protein RibD n=1 Tax=Neoehrlichia mikurensis TaxID=89586 RepID=A0A9Q9C0R0_9RICK|nr:bifunctional diaminohydroxyphosphoribosylaminopyrimidine deaminase/5-amino-6-(5-phosphoribosylamino)uracil reductase RibD [Neoehrlichia mikurensis]QXK92232.1 bifunctional diaminohydroxyphosphoribosylaminopyrimidine deaminase/5-amino-6-(5-phosphoribosylamino)uracil reductase RibD [Neoehrlichia mikurensis]QXK92687.1 bifunctional diaminohydroxyphosphoribosylaminopyrimidine deaminase/5-amino-6-(5-phosphoribosylamino)uracil reductase RibD [Neoehrlichia mikurensis]QXK93925.1 bifunctional diaminohyd